MGSIFSRGLIHICIFFNVLSRRSSEKRMNQQIPPKEWSYWWWRGQRMKSAGVFIQTRRKHQSNLSSSQSPDETTFEERASIMWRIPSDRDVTLKSGRSYRGLAVSVRDGVHDCVTCESVTFTTFLKMSEFEPTGWCFWGANTWIYSGKIWIQMYKVTLPHSAAHTACALETSWDQAANFLFSPPPKSLEWG